MSTMKSLPILLATALLAPAATASAAVTPPTPTGAGAGRLHPDHADRPPPRRAARRRERPAPRPDPRSGTRRPLAPPRPPRCSRPPSRPSSPAASASRPARSTVWVPPPPRPRRPRPGAIPSCCSRPAWARPPRCSRAHASDLASHGYVVVGIDVAGETYALDLGDGETVPVRITEASAESIALRTRDLRFVLGKLESMRGIGRLDRDRIGAFGHSNGGATAADAMLAGTPHPCRRQHRRRHLRPGPAAGAGPAVRDHDGRRAREPLPDRCGSSAAVCAARIRSSTTRASGTRASPTTSGWCRNSGSIRRG